MQFTVSSPSRLKIVAWLIIGFSLLGRMIFINPQSNLLQETLLNKEKVAEATTETNATKKRGFCNVPFQASEEFVITKPKQNTNAPLCSAEKLKTGSWKPIRLPGPVIKNGDECCTTEEYKNAKHWDSYFWEPEEVASGDCQFLSWDRDEFCRAAQNITIAISGDSLSLEQMMTLTYQLGYAEDVNEHKILLNSENIVLRVCNNQTTLVFRKGFYLEVVNKFLNDFTPNILVLNTGAWYRPDKTLRRQFSRRLGAIKNWYNKCQNQQLDYCLFVWRTTVPGHPQCDNFTKPATSVTEIENMVANLSLYTNKGRTEGRGPGAGGYHWWDFKHQNAIALKMMNESLTIPYEILPAYDINILRPDEHKAWNKFRNADCMHSCPGSSKLTVLNQILFQLMKIRKP
jgi:hypothetical protein